MPVADEIGHLTRGNTKTSKFFLEYGKKVPDEIWTKGVNKPSGAGDTHQGIYLMTPEGDYLGAHFGGHGVHETVRLLKEGLRSWKKIARKRGYQPKPIKPIDGRDSLYSIDPKQGQISAPDRGRLEGHAALVLQVHSRDLPGHEPAPRWSNRKNAWNKQWFELAEHEVTSLIPDGNGVHKVPDSLVRELGRRTFIDNVRGQTARWSGDQVREAKLAAKTIGRRGGNVVVRYRGTFKAGGGDSWNSSVERSMDLDIFGEAILDSNGGFNRLEIVAAGTRTGWTRHNSREGEGPSPIGFSITIEGQYRNN